MRQVQLTRETNHLSTAYMAKRVGITETDYLNREIKAYGFTEEQSEIIADILLIPAPLVRKNPKVAPQDRREIEAAIAHMQHIVKNTQ